MLISLYRVAVGSSVQVWQKEQKHKVLGLEQSTCIYEYLQVHRVPTCRTQGLEQR